MVCFPMGGMNISHIKSPFSWEQVAAPVRAQAAADSAASHLPSYQELYDWGLQIIRQDMLNSWWLQAAQKIELAIISFWPSGTFSENLILWPDSHWHPRGRVRPNCYSDIQHCTNGTWSLTLYFYWFYFLVFKKLRDEADFQRKEWQRKQGDNMNAYKDHICVNLLKVCLYFYILIWNTWSLLHYVVTSEAVIGKIKLH